ncbi:MAG: DUF4189 domain-containing protein [Alphaproteobacteria bacterium]
MKFKVAILLTASICLSFSASSEIYASERTKRVCAKNMANTSLHKGNYAFALSADREHCGWSWNAHSKKYSKIVALRNCEKRGDDCKIVHSGCKPNFGKKCSK